MATATAPSQKANWRTYTRHPLSAEYPDITGLARKEAIENLKEHGVFPRRKIILWEGKVVDGWQLYSWCIEADVEPDFEELELPFGMTIEDYLSTVQDRRRHETQTQAQKRINERRKRVEEGEKQGKSNRLMAEEEGVDEKTIRKDLEANKTSKQTEMSRSGADGSAPGKKGSSKMPMSEMTDDEWVKSMVGKKTRKAIEDRQNGLDVGPDDDDEDEEEEDEPPDRVKGRDGRSYSKVKPVLCDMCKRNGKVAGCIYCEELQRKGTKAATPRNPDAPVNGGEKPKPNGAPVFDDHKMTEALRKLALVINDRAIARKQTKSKGHLGVREAMGKLLDAWEIWQKEE